MPPRKIEPAEAAALRDQGWTYQRIGEKFGVSSNSARLAVVNYQRQAGVKQTSRKGKKKKTPKPSEDRSPFQFSFSRQDRERIDELRMHCGISRGADIVRLAVNTLAGDIRRGRAPKEVESPQETLAGQTTFRLDQADRRAISLIQEHYGLKSAAEVVRVSLVRLFQLLM